MKKLLIIMICCGLVLTGCCGSQRHVATMVAMGDIRVEPADDDTYDYKVSIVNITGATWDGKKKADRLKAVNNMFTEQCKSVTVLEEVPIQTGKYLFGNPAITYILKVKCEK